MWFAIILGFVGMVFLASTTRGQSLFLAWCILSISISLAVSSTIFGIIGLSKDEYPRRHSTISVMAVPILAATSVLSLFLATFVITT